MTAEMHTPDEVATRLKVSRRWLMEQVTARKVPHHFLSRRVMFTDDDIKAIIDAAARPVEAPTPAPLAGRARRYPTAVRRFGTGPGMV